jgi:uncharacterized protein (DUF433 family)
VSKVVSIRLKDEQYQELLRMARQERRTPSATAALLIDRELRERAFPLIEIRDTVVGEQAFLRGHRIKVWQVISLLRAYDGDVASVVDHLEEPRELIEAAIAYAARFPEETDAAIADNSTSVEELRKLLPNLRVFEWRETPAG